MMPIMLLAVAVCMTWTGHLEASDAVRPSDNPVRTVSAAAQMREGASVRDRASLEIGWWHYREGRPGMALVFLKNLGEEAGPLRFDRKPSGARRSAWIDCKGAKRRRLLWKTFIDRGTAQKIPKNGWPNTGGPASSFKETF